MITWFRRSAGRSVACLVLAAGLAMAGCQSTGGASDANLTPAQRELRAQTARFNQTVAEGAIAGALVGGVIGALASNDNPLAGAAIGAGAGAAVGAGAGYFVASQNESYATEEARLNAEIRAAQREVRSYQQIVDATQRVVDQHKATISQLSQQYRQGEITADQYRRQTEDIQTDIEQIRLSIDANRDQTQAIQARLGDLRQQGRNPAELAEAEQQLRAQRRQLEGQLDDLLASMEGAPVPVG
jgi:hypothetical protein